MTDEQRATISLRYGKVQITIGMTLVVGLFWLVFEAVSIRSTVTLLASERDPNRAALVRIETQQQADGARLARIEDRLDRRVRSDPQ